MLKFLQKIFGNKNEVAIKNLWPIVHKINEIYDGLKDLSDEELRAKTQQFKQRINDETAELRNKIAELKEKLKSNEDFDREAVYQELEALENELDEKYEEILDEILPEVFAIVKDTCRRLVGQSWEAAGNKITWDMIPYDVQLLGGIVLHQGKIAEMATGEGKTLVATMPVFLNALTGRGVHVVTVNDYLAKRDSEWMGKIYQFHGLTVGCILNTMDTEQRKKMYNCDITYGTNNEFGFDYLRDNMAIDASQIAQRGHNYAIVDEVDSVLIDEARTPLIISGPVDRDDHQFYDMKPLVERLVKAQTNYVAKILAEAEKILSEDPNSFEGGMLLLRAHRGLPKSKKLLKLLNEEGYKKLMLDVEAEFLRDQMKRMHEIDDELYFVIDEKNHTIDITEKGLEELSRGSSESKEFFIIPDLAAQLSALENENLTFEEKARKKEEIYKIYSERSERIHTIHQLLRAYVMFNRDDEYIVSEDGKVLIVDEFTGRVLPGRRYSDGLHQAIEAKENLKVERDTQTLATITLQNYFRLYKKLAGMTGTAETEEAEFYDIYKLEVVVIPTNKPVIREDLDDLIYRTKREKYNAVIKKIEELRNQQRPVLVGTTSVEVSETLSRMLKRKRIPHNVLNAKQHQREAEIIAFAGQPSAVTIATNMAGRGTDIKLGPGVKEKGGLYIIGTERHESRRIDRQLRGRAGRQGDPGTSQFYLSLEDDLLRLFGSDRIASVMQRMGVEEGEVIQHPMITKSVERAQKKVEENNFAIRKRLLEYDNVMNNQREVIYKKRRKAIEGERLKGEVFNMLEEYVDELIEEHFEDANIDAINEALQNRFLIKANIKSEEFESIGKDGLKQKIIEAAKFFYQEKEKALGSDLMARIERFAFLSVIDEKWKEHLRNMDDLKEGIHLRAYGQKDPLIEYKKESFELFVNLLNEIRNDILSFCFRFFPQQFEEEQQRRRRRQVPQRYREVKENVDGMRASGEGEAQVSQRGKLQPIVVDEKIGRNDPCPCGSGKKYKHCCGRNL